jgi:hypothetical protein
LQKCHLIGPGRELTATRAGIHRGGVAAVVAGATF